MAGLGALMLGGRARAASGAWPNAEAERAPRGAPALGLAWQHRQDAPQVRVAGTLSVNRAEPVQPAARWHLGSLTKSMTATLAARAVEAGWIGWDATVADTLGPMADGMREDYAGVTLLHLLSHRAGLPPDLERKPFASFTRGVLDDARAERLRYALLALGMKPVAAPGSQRIYANNGYVVAGAMLEARMGAPWEALIRRWLFEPLGLSSAGFGPPEGPTEPEGHIMTPQGAPWPVAIDNPVAMGPAGRVHMALGDLLTYLAAHRDRDPRLLTRASWDALHRPHFGGDYALGWIVLPDGRLWHNGSNSLWYAEAMIGRNGVAALAQNDGRAMAGVPSALVQRLLAGR